MWAVLQWQFYADLLLQGLEFIKDLIGILIQQSFDPFLSDDTPIQTNKLSIFLTKCQTRCDTLDLLNDYSDFQGEIDLESIDILKSYCCEFEDVDENGNIDENGEYGPEICALSTNDCIIDEESIQQICENYELNSVEGCEING